MTPASLRAVSLLGTAIVLRVRTASSRWVAIPDLATSTSMGIPSASLMAIALLGCCRARSPRRPNASSISAVVPSVSCARRCGILSSEPASSNRAEQRTLSSLNLSISSSASRAHFCASGVPSTNKRCNSAFVPASFMARVFSSIVHFQRTNAADSRWTRLPLARTSVRAPMPPACFMPIWLTQSFTLPLGFNTTRASSNPKAWSFCCELP
mmetsp:Transcript_38359/g.105667  ORF Transcript_38359/g.105667 Transcript_38359/m.105667 type:complete len:211 (+) Transcript_38359:121-753(+)